MRQNESKVAVYGNTVNMTSLIDSLLDTPVPEDIKSALLNK